MKPMLACDWDQTKLKFPVIAQPKIDGVRGLNMTGKLTGRSLKPFKNRYTTAFYSHSALAGLDGELAAEHHTNPDLCRITASALGTIAGEPYTLWWLFDYVTPETKNMCYSARLYELVRYIDWMNVTFPNLASHLRIMECKFVENMEQLLAVETKWLDMGYEGVILRDPNGVHKQGRCTVREGGLLRIKRFVDFEFVVHEIIEGEENQNEAQINELGLTFRTSHQENKVPNGMIGAMLGRTLNVVKGLDGEILFQAGQEVKVSAGRLTHEQRRYYFQNQDEFKKLTHKAKFFPRGIMDKPRFPTWQMIRNEND